MMNSALKEVFCEIKPICDAIMVYPSLENVEMLQNVLKIIPKESYQDMQLYILFPIISHLKWSDLK